VIEETRQRRKPRTKSTGNLDTKNAGRVFDIFERLVAEDDRSVVIVTHDPDLAARTHRRIHIVDGRIGLLGGAARRRG
jgi:ABC-type lipoprotein export system ATPase subunit